MNDGIRLTLSPPADLVNPSASPGLMWSDAGNPVPIESARFDEISTFLAAFVA
jgi:hypothetical protein